MRASSLPLSSWTAAQIEAFFDILSGIDSMPFFCVVGISRELSLKEWDQKKSSSLQICGFVLRYETQSNRDKSRLILEKGFEYMHDEL